MNVAAYIRVSTDGQVGEDKFGMDSQKSMIEEYCAAHDMKIIRWYKDEGESGAKERPGFDEIIYGDVQNPPVEAIIVAKSDRVARDINIYYYYKMMLKKKDITLISITEDFGQFGVFANMLEAFTLCVAEMERENITKRTSGGRAIKAKGGAYSGGRLPLGYKSENKSYVIVPEEAEIVRLAFKLRGKGWTLQAVADKLNELGYQTKRGNGFNPSTLNILFNNEPLYRGMYKYGNNEWVQGVHEPILKEEDK